MKILITGGAGYIGSTLCGYLLNNNHQVTVLDTFMFSNDSLNSYMSNKNFSVYQEDVRNIKTINKYASKNDVIIPLACLVGAPLCNLKEEEAEQVNFHSIKKMVDVLSKDQYVVYPTTNSGYGVGEKGKFCTEETPLKPISVYGKTKVQAEEYLANNFQNSTRLRLATVFGLSGRIRTDLLVNDFTYRAVFKNKIELFEPHFKRNYIHVNDVARVIVFCIENFKKLKNNIYNIGLENANLSKLELCKLIKKNHNTLKISINEFNKDPDQRNYIVSNKKILSTGWRPKHSLNSGIKELIKCYKSLNIQRNSNI